jgi:hypothetical protein
MRNTTCFVLSLSFALLGSCSESASPQTPEAKASMLATVHASAKRCGAATIEGNFEELLSLTYPAIVEKMGGIQKAARLLASGTKGMKFDSYVVSKPTAIHSKGGYYFVIVPTEMAMTVRGTAVEGTSFLLGISGDQGRTWTFADGSGIKNPKGREMLPDLPAAMVLPEVKVVPRDG